MRVRDIVTDRLGALGLQGTQKKSPSELSGGMRTWLDPLATRNVDEMILATCERYKVTSVVISHDMASVFRIAGGQA